MDLLQRSRAAVENPDNAVYAGWLKYLSCRVETAAAKSDEDEATSRTLQLAQWLEKIESNPEAVEELRGTHEWAYLSKVDESGQPFTIKIPDDYDASKPWPLQVSLHGFGALHGGGWGEEHPKPYIELFVLGRGRGGGYIGLSEIDVLEAMDYVKAHWNVDPRRTYIRGGSMGGGGTFKLASRFPHLWAAAWPLMGFGLDIPLENLRNVPLHALHCVDDHVVPIGMSRLAVQKLASMGTAASIKEFTGWGHDLWKNQQAQQEAQEWALAHEAATPVRSISYSAQDELARRAYWMEVVEWGAESAPASFTAYLNEANELFLTLKNTRTAKVDLAQSPADSSKPLSIFVGGQLIEKLPAPLPETIWVNQARGWKISKEAPEMPKHRLHYPGGAMALYHGEPLLVVWGTQGDDATDEALEQAALAARRSCLPQWSMPARAGAPMVGYQEFALLPGKADTEVSDEDLLAFNLLLLGDATQNALVARMEKDLPARIVDHSVRTTDNLSWDFKDRAMGVLYYNPLAPQRLVYWVAADTLEFYNPRAPLMAMQSQPFSMSSSPDFLLMDAVAPEVVAARRFGSRWQWDDSYEGSSAVSEKASTSAGNAEAIGAALCKATGSDFALALADLPTTQTVFAPGETRKADVAALFFDQKIVTAEITGEDLLAAISSQQPAGGRQSAVAGFFPKPDPNSIKPKKVYKLAMLPWTVWDASKLMLLETQSMALTDLDVREALARYY